MDGLDQIKIRLEIGDWTLEIRLDRLGKVQIVTGLDRIRQDQMDEWIHEIRQDKTRQDEMG